MDLSLKNHIRFLGKHNSVWMSIDFYLASKITDISLKIKLEEYSNFFLHPLYMNEVGFSLILQIQLITFCKLMKQLFLRCQILELEKNSCCLCYIHQY